VTSRLGTGKPLTFIQCSKAIWLFQGRFSTLFSSQQTEEYVFKKLAMFECLLCFQANNLKNTYLSNLQCLKTFSYIIRNFFYLKFFICEPNGTSESIATAATAPAEAPDTFIKSNLNKNRKIKSKVLKQNVYSHVVESCYLI